MKRLHFFIREILISINVQNHYLNPNIRLILNIELEGE